LVNFSITGPTAAIRLMMPNETKSDGNGFMWTPAVLFRDDALIARGRRAYPPPATAKRTRDSMLSPLTASGAVARSPVRA
jgi:hypothetical protein